LTNSKLLTGNGKKRTVNVFQKIESEDLYAKEARKVHSRVHPVAAINILATVSQGHYNHPHLAN